MPIPHKADKSKHDFVGESETLSRCNTIARRTEFAGIDRVWRDHQPVGSHAGHCEFCSKHGSNRQDDIGASPYPTLSCRSESRKPKPTEILSLARKRRIDL